MRLLDRIALNRLISRLLDLIIKIASMFAPNKGETNPKVPTKPKKRKKIFPNLHIRENTDE